MVAREQGWTSGYPDGTFRPSNPVTRAEAVTMINQCLNRVADIAAIDGGEAARFFPDVQPGDWFYYQVMEAAVGHTAHYETPEASELWLSPEVPSALLADGFYCINGKLYAAVNGDYLHEAGSGTLNGVRYTCAGASGVCTVQGELLTLATGELIFLNNGKPVYAPGRYPNGFHYRYGKLYAAVNGNLVNKQTTGTLNGVSYTCAGASGVCTAKTEILTAADGNRWHLKNNVISTTAGLYEISGAMYYAQSSGMMLRNGDYHTLHFGNDCRYTSGNSTIDSYIDKIVASQTNSSMTRERKLFALYCYVAYNSNRYISNNNHVPRGQDGSQWLEPYMLRLIQMGGGNCYCYAAQFYYLARRVGYWQAKGVSGGTSPNNMDHGWVEMELNGTLYLFDPRLDGSYYIRQQHEAPGRLYMKTYDNLPWRYWRP